MRPLIDRVKSVAGVAARGVAGRRNLARAARFLGNAARLDLPNDILRNGEMLIQETVIRHAPPDIPLIVFDVGANVGAWTLQFLARKRGNDFALHAFEPVSSTARMFRNNVRNPNVFLSNMALSDTSGNKGIAVYRDGAGTNALVPDPDESVQYTESVQVTTVDDYCRLHGIDRVTLLKVDAEGHDLFVLRGARKLLSAKKIGVVQFEYNHRWIWSRAFLLDAFNLAGDAGYELGKVTPYGVEFYRRWDKELETFREGNYLICHPDWVRYFPCVRWWNE